MTRQIEFTDEEVRGLTALLDLACKSGGLQVAENCIYFMRKLTPPAAPPKEG